MLLCFMTKKAQQPTSFYNYGKLKIEKIIWLWQSKFLEAIIGYEASIRHFVGLHPRKLTNHVASDTHFIPLNIGWYYIEILLMEFKITYQNMKLLLWYFIWKQIVLFKNIRYDLQYYCKICNGTIQIAKYFNLTSKRICKSHYILFEEMQFVRMLCWSFFQFSIWSAEIKVQFYDMEFFHSRKIERHLQPLQYIT